MDKAVDRPEPLQDDIEKIVTDRINETYKTCTGAAVDYFSSISLLNRYVMSLPVDFFTKSTVEWRRINKEHGKMIVAINLPLQSPIKHEIFVSELNKLYKNR